MEAEMQVGEIMTTRVELIDSQTTLRDAARRMREQNIGALPVGDNDRLVGMVTDRDITVNGVADDLPGKTPVRDVMAEGIVYCFEDDDVAEASRLMADHQVRRLPVLNRDKRLCGIVALADIALYRDDPNDALDAIEGVSEQSEEPRSGGRE
jgi:CBS domain-containing protein